MRGGAAGKLNTNGTELLVFGKQFGNVFIGVQPTFGYEGDPMRLLFSRSASPHHGFAAYYTFLERIFQAGGGPCICLALTMPLPSVLAVRLQQKYTLAQCQKTLSRCLVWYGAGHHNVCAGLLWTRGGAPA